MKKENGMKTKKRSYRWFEREYKFLRQDVQSRVWKDAFEEEYISMGLVYCLYFDKAQKYTGSAVYDSQGNLMENYEVRQ